MKANQLLYWMSHLGEGTWESFKNAVQELAEPEEKEEDILRILIRRTRFRLSDIGSVDFSVKKRLRWQVLEPVLASFTETPERAVLCGGRSPLLIEQLEGAAKINQCTFQSQSRLSSPDQILLTGRVDALNQVAASCLVKRSVDFAEEMFRQFVPIGAYLAAAPPGELMIGWKRQYFDLNAKQWTEKPILRTACECISQYGRRMTFLQVSKKRTLVLPRREAIYAAASLAGVPIVSYEISSLTLRVPVQSPLPENYARLACISSGNIGTINDGTISYSPVPRRIAQAILASLGQTH
jgi:hypothetical protein